MKRWCSMQTATEIMAMELGSGEVGALVSYGRFLGIEQFLRGMWVYFTLQRAGARKHLADAAREKARSVATRVSTQRGSGANLEKCGYRLRSPDDASCLPRNEAG